MKIAILGWGSLIWNPGPLQLASRWTRGGPTLPIEFSRISDNGRLTLVIDERHGVDVPTRFARSSLDELDAARIDLQRREGAPNRDRIGFLDLARKFTCERAKTQHPLACSRIVAWAEDQKFDAVIWTAIGPRFRSKTGVSFSADAAVSYISRLSGKTKALALDYIRMAPADVLTPVRDRVTVAFGPFEVAAYDS